MRGWGRYPTMRPHQDGHCLDCGRLLSRCPWARYIMYCPECDAGAFDAAVDARIDDERENGPRWLHGDQ